MSISGLIKSVPVKVALAIYITCLVLGLLNLLEMECIGSAFGFLLGTIFTVRFYEGKY